MNKKIWNIVACIISGIITGLWLAPTLSTAALAFVGATYGSSGSSLPIWLVLLVCLLLGGALFFLWRYCSRNSFNKKVAIVVQILCALVVFFIVMRQFMLMLGSAYPST